MFAKIINLDLPKHVERLALETCKKLQKNSNKGKGLTTAPFFAIYSAYRELKIPFDPIELAEKTSVKTSNIDKIIFNYHRIGFSLPSVKYRPHDFIKIFSIYLNICGSDYKHIYSLIDKLFDIDKELEFKKPQLVAVGVLYYYSSIKGTVKDNKSALRCMSKCVNNCESTIESMYKYICVLDNKKMICN